MRLSALAPLFAAGLLAVMASAQSTIVIPNGTATTEGNSSNTFPWGRGATGILQQCLYDSSNFTLQGVTGPVTISRLRWRPNTSASSIASSYATGATVKLSTSPVDQSAITTTFANQRGADLTTVFTGPVSWPAAAAVVGPCPFLIDIPFTTPFVYDPYAGDLNIEIDLPIQTFTGTALNLDVQTTGSNSSRAFLTTGYANGGPNTTATGITTNHGVVVEVTYTPVVGAATIAPYGTGCYDINGVPFYELFATAPAFDLANRSVVMIFNGSKNYSVLPGGSTYVPPSGSAVSVALGDDVEQTVTLASPFRHSGGVTSSLTICSNGYVSTASGNGTGFTPATASFLAFGQTCFSAGWHDYNPALTGSGTIKFEEVGSISYVTWDGVWDFGGTSAANASTVQYQFDRSNGNVHIIWQTMSTLGNGFLVGFKPGGPVTDPGPIDISVALPAGIQAHGNTAALALSTSQRPVVGSTVNLNSANVPANSGLGAVILSYTQNNPGLDLTGLGMPGCRQYVGLDATRFFVPSGGTGTVPLSVPNNPTFSGLHVFTQSAVLSAGANVLGALSSNGLDLRVGTL